MLYKVFYPAKFFFQKTCSILELVFESMIKTSNDNGQLFIVGLPRSGATLIYQYIVHRLHVAYFTNGAGNNPLYPLLTTAIQKFFRKPYKSDFKSNYGRISGPMAPREAGKIWGRFFLPDKFQQGKDISEAQKNRLYKTVVVIQELFGGATFVNKNVRNSLHMEALADIFPYSKFLIVERDIMDIGISILRARKLTHGDYNLWFSVRPRNYESIKNLSIPEQIYHQIKDIRECIKESANKIGSIRVKKINYENFCEKPEIVIDMFSDLFKDVKEKNPPVPHFISKKQHPNTPLEKELTKYLEKLKSFSF